jgi:hypothetical protein
MYFWSELKRKNMKVHGKTIKIFLIDGDPNGRMTCELSNWTGKVYKIPRIKVKDCSDRNDLENTGVYLLFGKDTEDSDLVYIGEAESILKRLNQHLSQKEFWNEAIVIISKDENLNKAHVKYLENRLYEIARETGRYNIENSVTPTQSSISESDRAELEEFIDNIRIMVNTLGHKVFEDTRASKSVIKAQTFLIKATRGADASGRPVSDGFVVLKDSKAAFQVVDSMPVPFNKLRDKLLEKGKLIERDGCLIFKEDVLFSSPSTAASVVMGRNANGLIEWKQTKGVTLKEFESNGKNGK